MKLEAGAEAERVRLAAAAEAEHVRLDAMARADGTRAIGEAEATATQAKGLAEGEAVRAKGMAEAESIEARADALAENQDAVIGQQLAEQVARDRGRGGQAVRRHRPDDRAQRRPGPVRDPGPGHVARASPGCSWPATCWQGGKHGNGAATAPSEGIGVDEVSADH